MRELSLNIGGMSCINCQNRIEKALKGTGGVECADVNYAAGVATISYDGWQTNPAKLKAVIEKLGYEIITNKAKKSEKTISQIIGYGIIIVALYMLARQVSVSPIATSFPLAEAGMGYGVLFVIGLITSVHCLAMCGGINLSQTIPQADGNGTTLLKPAILYNTGRVVSYTLVGGLVGALGSVLTVSGRFQGAVQMFAGIFMVIMGLNMLGMFTVLRRFNLRLPRFLSARVNTAKSSSKSPLIVGLLNGFMPCGPLQAMQLYALSTENPIAGAASMFMFSLGTTPAMFALGVFSSALGGQWTAKAMKAGAVVVAALGLTMFSNGWGVSGMGDSIIPSVAVAGQADEVELAAYQSENTGGQQVVRSKLDGWGYPAITVKAGIPVRWIIDVPQGTINGCNYRMLIREYGIQHQFKVGENVIEFTPRQAGRFAYTCWMGMIRSTITVVAK
ncbi:hypothetical protein RsTz2092_01660 [Deferribacterales bacterium RsTz2092]|nr:hypothetical protein AGMMS49941_00110 [Deferribacterales bacterium]